MSIVKATDTNFEQEVLNISETVLVDFYADWCGPCKMVAPILEEIAKEDPELKIVKVNIDENPELASRYRVMSIPTLMVFKAGDPMKPMVGAGSKQQILSLLK